MQLVWLQILSCCNAITADLQLRQHALQNLRDGTGLYGFASACCLDNGVLYEVCCKYACCPQHTTILVVCQFVFLHHCLQPVYTACLPLMLKQLEPFTGQNGLRCCRF